MLLLEAVLRMRRFDAQSGFTLNEVLIVIVILGILVAAVLGIGRRLKEQGNEKLCRSTMEVLDTAIEQYYDYRGEFPSSGVSLYQQLYGVPTSRKICEQIQASQVAGFEFIDPWGEPLDYQYDAIAGETFPVIVSGGPDGKLITTADNISSK
jgi:prepilin-type N-terminal cleavage/methylation domain-containing protein